LHIVDPLQLSFRTRSYPAREQNWLHHVSSTFTTSFGPCGREEYHHALPSGIYPAKVEYESPRTATVRTGVCAHDIATTDISTTEIKKCLI
jgi:hypothetical protein